MLFTTTDNFKSKTYEVSNINGTTDVRHEMAKFIGEYERKARLTILGACLNKEVEDSMELSSGIYVIKDTATIPIKNLILGDIEYTKPVNSDYNGCGCGCGSSNCEKRYWNGFNEQIKYLFAGLEETITTSNFTPYVYYHYLLINRSITTGVGQQIINAENSVTVSNFSKRIDAWNDFMFWVLGGRDGFTSLYQFLEDNIADYPTWDKNCSLNFKDKW